ncbi:MAG: hypothetical protein AAB597_01390 [Patescibacteria group bacterium]
MKKLSRKKLAERFRIPLEKKLTKRQEEKAKAANDLLEALSFRTGIRIWELFCLTYPGEDKTVTSKRMGHTLRNMCDCPQEVLDRAEALIAERHLAELEKTKNQ